MNVVSEARPIPKSEVIGFAKHRKIEDIEAFLEQTETVEKSRGDRR